jgi:hypothetical protein
MNRVASSSQYIALTSINRIAFTGYGIGGYGVVGNVQAVSQSPHNLVLGQKFSIFNTPDPSFVGAFTVTAIVDQYTFNYIQNQPAAVTSGGAVVLWLRLYETSSEELSIQDPFWRNQNITHLSSWYEDRQGNYKWGVNGRPATSLPVEVLVSQRDTDTLAFTDYWLVPDPCLHYVKYKALEYCFSKDGEMRDPMRAKYCGMRFARGVQTVRRWMEGMGVESGMAEAATRG